MSRGPALAEAGSARMAVAWEAGKQWLRLRSTNVGEHTRHDASAFVGSPDQRHDLPQLSDRTGIELHNRVDG